MSKYSKLSSGFRAKAELQRGNTELGNAKTWSQVAGQNGWQMEDDSEMTFRLGSQFSFSSRIGNKISCINWDIIFWDGKLMKEAIATGRLPAFHSSFSIRSLKDGDGHGKGARHRGAKGRSAHDGTASPVHQLRCGNREKLTTEF